MNANALLTRGLLRCSGAALLSFAICGQASATGFFVPQQSVQAFGRAGAGDTAAADDLGTIFFNPAGLIQLWNDSPGPTFRAAFGVNVIIPLSEIRNTGSTAVSPGTLGTPLAYGGGNTKNPTAPTPVPNVYFATELADGRAVIGAGINVPFGLTSYSQNDWFGRYDAIKARLTTINISLVGAYEINSNLSIGGGIDTQYAEAKLVTAIPNPFAPGGPSFATDAHSETIGHAWTPGFNLGLLYRAGPNTRIGVHYRNGMTHKIDGSTTFSDLPGPLAGFNGVVGSRADFKLPAIATIGLRHQIDSLVLLGEFEWSDWSTFEEVRITFEDGRPDAVHPTHYRDAYGAAIGAEYHLMDWILRGGIHYETTPTVDAFRDTIVPDAERLWLAVGLTYRLSDSWNLDFSFTHIFFRETSIGVTRTFFENTPLATAVQINGAVKYAVETVGFNLRHAF